MDAKGFEQDADLARLSGLDAGVLSRWQSGAVQPSVDKLRMVAPHLGVRLGDLMVRAGLATPAELGMEGAPPPPSVPLPPVLRRIAITLADTRIPQAARDQLLGGIQAALDMWLNMLQVRAPKEPSAAQRAGRRSSSLR